MVHKVIIIGSGPAGLTAGIYTGRSKLAPIIIDGNQPGGQLTTTTRVENWPGVVSVLGPELMQDMRKQAEVCGATFISDEVISADVSKKPYTIATRAGKSLQTETLIIASGATSRRLECPGEAEYWGKGVTTCATCDAPFMEGREVVVVGGGNSAVTEAEHLSKYASKVTLVHILDQLTATDPIKDKVLQDPKIDIMYNATIVEMKGHDDHVQEVVIEDQKNHSRTTLPAYGVFVAIGLIPNTKMFQGQLELDQYGYIVLKEHQMTTVPGVFAAGDVTDYRYKQAITSSGDGCKAALDCEIYLTGTLSVTYTQ